jgi:hypothetical protein
VIGLGNVVQTRPGFPSVSWQRSETMAPALASTLSARGVVPPAMLRMFSGTVLPMSRLGSYSAPVMMALPLK